MTSMVHLCHTRHRTHLLLYGQQLHDVLVVDLLEDVKLPHLHLVGPHVAELVERLHGDRLAILLSTSTKITTLSALFHTFH